MYSNMIWEKVKNFEGKYDVSDTGQVRSIVDNKGNHRVRMLKIHISKNGYPMVSLKSNGKSYHVLVHRLVAHAFIHNPLNLPQVNHKDENKTNNNVSNLEWCTAKYNCCYGSRNRKMISKLRRDYRSFHVQQIDLKGNVVGVFFSMREAQRITGIRESGISKCICGELKTSGGFRWERISDI